MTAVQPSFQPFVLKTDFIELVSLLKAAGVYPTGGEASQAVRGGQVLVDGAVETRRGRKIRRGQKILTPNGTLTVE